MSGAGGGDGNGDGDGGGAGDGGSGGEGGSLTPQSAQSVPMSQRA